MFTLFLNVIVMTISQFVDLGTVTTLCPMYVTEKYLCESQIQLCIVRSGVLGQPATHPCRKFKEFLPRVYSLTFPDISASFVT